MVVVRFPLFCVLRSKKKVVVRLVVVVMVQQIVENPDEDDEKKDKKIIPLDADDIALLKTYGVGPYGTLIKNLETDLVSCVSRVDKLCGIKESDTGLAPPSRWDLTADKQATQEEHPLQVARCTKIINPGTTDAQYLSLIHI